MYRLIGTRALTLLLAAGLECSQFNPSHAQEFRLDSRDAVVRWLRHQEEVARSAECEMEVRTSPTSPEMVPMVRELAHLTNRNPVNYLIDDRYVQDTSYTSRWVRSGTKERMEQTFLDGSTVVTAFDGQIVRAVAKRGGEYSGSINTVESSSWANIDRLHPFAFLYLYREIPYSQLVETSPRFRIDKESKADQVVTRVRFDHPTHKAKSFVLLFEPNGDLVERQIIRPSPTDKSPKPFAGEIQILSDYESFPSPNGEPVRFPRYAEFRHHMGQLPNGTLVEYMRETVRIKNIKFNIDVPEETFDLRIPRSAEVWDGVTGLGFMKPGDRPEHLFPEDARRKRWITVGIVVAIALALTIGVVWYRKRRRRLATV